MVQYREIAKLSSVCVVQTHIRSLATGTYNFSLIKLGIFSGAKNFEKLLLPEILELLFYKCSPFWSPYYKTKTICKTSANSQKHTQFR